MKYSYKVNKDYNSVTDFLSYYFLGKSKLKTIDHILINGNDASLKSLLKIDDELILSFIEEIDFKIDKENIDILYEDDYLLLINKPINLMVHPDDKDKNGTLVNRVAYYYQQNNQNRSIRYLHRIDTDTTGIIMFAKDPLTNSYMGKMIEKHEVKRTYLAITNGKVKEQNGTIDLPIGEDRHHKSRRRVSKTGQTAITNYEVVKYLKNNMTLVKVVLKTGRTHQIRVHMSHIGNPLAGDELYNGSPKFISRQALHSYEVEFLHPFTGDLIKITADIPSDMAKLIDNEKRK